MNQFNFNNYEDHKINFIDVTASSWSPKRDLIALGSSNGEIYLYRLQMILIWKVSVKNEGTITSICWHPDGNIFAVGFGSGIIQYYSMYHPNSLYKVQYDGSVSSMQWISNNAQEYINEEVKNSLYNINSIFPTQENLSQISVYKEDIKRMEEILVLNAKFSILIGISGFSIFFLARGIFHLGSISLESFRTSSSDRLLSANLSPHSDSVSYTMQMYNDKGNQIIRTDVLNCGFIRENKLQISNVSSLVVEMIYLRLLLQLHMKEIEESWEDCLNDFESGIIDYSKNKEHLPNWSLRTDFMEMVLYGCCNKDFWSTLQKSLPICQFKQISDRTSKMSEHIINHCCPNMHLVLMRLLFHCNELGNILRCSSEYGVLYLSNEKIAEVTDVCRSTLLKLHEFQAILSDNMDNLKLFFQWISNGIENHAGDIDAFKSFSYSELSTIMDFITNKLTVVKNGNNEIISYKIEILHQYLIDDDLISPQLADNNNFLLNFMKEMTEEKWCGTETSRDGIFHIKSEKSLTNMVRRMVPNAVDGICWKDEKLFIRNNYHNSDCYSITLATFPYLDEENFIIVTESYLDDNSDNGVVEVYCLYDSCSSVLVWVQNNTETIKSCLLHLDNLHSQYPNQYIKISKMQFFNANTLFLLVSIEKDGVLENSYLLVLSWNYIEENYIEKIRVHYHHELRNEFFSIWSTGEQICLKLSAILTPTMLEIIPVDAVDMTISCSRNLALVFFGKTRERCRIYFLNDE